MYVQYMTVHTVFSRPTYVHIKCMAYNLYLVAPSLCPVKNALKVPNNILLGWPRGSICSRYRR